MDAIARFAEHVATTRFEDMPESAVAAAETMIFDTIGVGIGGSSGPMAVELADAQELNGRGDDAHVWSLGKRLPAAAAAQCNAYQAHNSEFDCVHEDAVAHVLTAIVPACMAHAERTGGIDGRRFIEAVVLGVDVASNLGVAAISGLRFFRPATVGAFGAAAALSKLRGFDAARTIDAFSIAYGQVSGTMQAHEEGSMLLAMQMGFNTRNAVIASDLASLGFTGPQNVLEGRFGYFGLIETHGDIQAELATLGHNWRIEEVAHKPFPSGRATHGVLDGCMVLQRRHGIDADAIASITAVVPPLIEQLVGRPYRPDMELNYARLCIPYVVARALNRGTIDLGDFHASAYQDAATRRLAEQVSISVREGDPPNALTPVDVTVTLADGTAFSHHVDAVYGSPQNPFERDGQVAKFHANCEAAQRPIAHDQATQLIDRLSDLRNVADVAELVPLMIAPDA
ncbi:MAG: MmgE/PrpD family protein [Hyphomicrobiaceae bacterium]